MKIEEFVEKITNNRFMEIEKVLDIKKYLPIQEKKEIAQLIIDECTQISNGLIKLDSIQQYMSYTKHMILSQNILESAQQELLQILMKQA